MFFAVTRHKARHITPKANLNFPNARQRLRLAPARARLNVSMGAVSDTPLSDHHRAGTLWQVFAKCPLVEFGDYGTFEFVAFIEESHAKRRGDITFEYIGVFGQFITVRGDMRVEISPAIKALRVMSATRTILAKISRPSALSYVGDLARTIAASSSWPR